MYKNIFFSLVAEGYLSVLCEVMVQQLGVGLLVRRQNVQERCRGVARRTTRVQGPRSS